MNRDLDHCPGCGRRIIDTDDLGCEDAHGQRWCIEHAMRALASLVDQVVTLERAVVRMRTNAKQMSKRHQQRVAELLAQNRHLRDEIKYLTED